MAVTKAPFDYAKIEQALTDYTKGAIDDASLQLLVNAVAAYEMLGSLLIGSIINTPEQSAKRASMMLSDLQDRRKRS